MNNINIEHYELLLKYKSKTLKDAKTKLFIKAKNDIYILKVDNGIIPWNKGIKKCDYLTCSENTKLKEVNFIELKGKNIDKAYKQIISSIEYIENDNKLSFIIDDVKKCMAYIVSKEKNKIPEGIESKEKELAKKLYSKTTKCKPKNILDLIKYVCVFDSNSCKSSYNGRKIICNEKSPLLL